MRQHNVEFDERTNAMLITLSSAIKDEVKLRHGISLRSREGSAIHAIRAICYAAIEMMTMTVRCGRDVEALVDFDGAVDFLSSWAYRERLARVDGDGMAIEPKSNSVEHEVERIVRDRTREFTENVDRIISEAIGRIKARESTIQPGEGDGS